MKLLNKYERLAEKYNELDSDLERINFLKKNKDWFTVQLDNDSSQVAFNIVPDVEDDEEDLIREIHLEGFDYSFGDENGVFTLFEALGIEAQMV